MLLKKTTNAEYCKKYYNANKDRCKFMSKQWRIHREMLVKSGKIKKPAIKTKQCTSCKQNLDIEKFAYRTKRGMYESMCKKCRCAQAKLYRQKSSKRISVSRKQFRERKKKTDPSYMIEKSLRSRIHKVLTKKTISTSKLLGADKMLILKWFRYNVELDAHTGMTMENRGSVWHIDHVIPCNKFNLTKENEQLMCMNWTNLKPVLAHKNISKNDNIIIMQCIEHEIRLKQFGKIYNIKLGNFTMKAWVHSRGVLTTAANGKSLVQQME